MLGIAYAATIGGMGTLIGTPPNALFASLMESTYGVTIGFAQWMLLGVPVVVVLVPLSWLCSLGSSSACRNRAIMAPARY